MSSLLVKIDLAKIRGRRWELLKKESLLLIARRSSELAKRLVMVDKIFVTAKTFQGLNKSSPIRVN